MFFDSAAIQQRKLLARVTPGIEFTRTDVWCGISMLHQFAEGFGWHVDAFKQGISSSRPTSDAVGQDVNTGIAQAGQKARSLLRQAVAVVDQHQTHVLARRQPKDIDLEPAIRQRYRKKQMTFAELPGFANVKERDFLFVLKPLLECAGVDGC